MHSVESMEKCLRVHVWILLSSLHIHERDSTSFPLSQAGTIVWALIAGILQRTIQDLKLSKRSACSMFCKQYSYVFLFSKDVQISRKSRHAWWNTSSLIFSYVVCWVCLSLITDFRDCLGMYRELRLDSVDMSSHPHSSARRWYELSDYMLSDYMLTDYM